MEITHKIKQGWRWTDGTPVTPRDVIYWWTLVMDPDFAVPSREQTEKIYDIEMVDDNTYIVKLMSQAQVRAAAAGTLEGNVDFKAYQADYVALGYAEWNGPVVDPVYWIIGTNWLPAHILQDIRPQTRPRANSPGCRPATALTSSRSGDPARRSSWKRPTCPGPCPIPRSRPSSSASWRNLGHHQRPENGEVDAAASSVGGLTVANAPDLDPIDAEGVYKVNYAPGYNWEHIDLNVDKFPLDDLRVRQALYYAVDKQALVDTLYYGKQSPTDLPIPKGLSWAYTDNYIKYPYDPEKAAALLAEAGGIAPPCPAPTPTARNWSSP